MLDEVIASVYGIILMWEELSEMLAILVDAVFMHYRSRPHNVRFYYVACMSARY